MEGHSHNTFAPGQIGIGSHCWVFSTSHLDRAMSLDTSGIKGAFYAYIVDRATQYIYLHYN